MCELLPDLWPDRWLWRWNRWGKLLSVLVEFDMVIEAVYIVWWLAVAFTVIFSSPAAPELMCDFEEGLCSWTQEHEEDMFDWTHIQGPTSTFNTGPWKDHTRANAEGHFLYIEASDPQKFKDTAVLISRPFFQTPRRDPESKPTCAFRFHYHMFGQHVFRLAVYKRTRNSGRGNLLWVRYGDQGNFWHRKTLLINSAHHFQVSFDQNYEDWSVRV